VAARAESRGLPGGLRGRRISWGDGSGPVGSRVGVLSVASRGNCVLNTLLLDMGGWGCALSVCWSG
jgi:hypothetical protein